MLLDISVSSRFEKNKKGGQKGRHTNYGKSIYKWPRKYGMKVENSIKNETWELRDYAPSVNRY